MKKIFNVCLIMLSAIHRICPLCAISRKFPKSEFAKGVLIWSKICPFCNIYFLAKRKKLM